MQSDVKVGDVVSIVMPNNATLPGTVTYVGTVATVPSANSGGGNPTINVDIAPKDPAATGTLDQLPVEVWITEGTADNVLVVPVDALLALAGGGYAVEAVGAGGRAPPRGCDPRALRRRRRACPGERAWPFCRPAGRGPQRMTAPFTLPYSAPASPVAGDRLAVGNDPPLVLELDDVTKTYPGEPPVEALRGVSFTVRRGELVGIVGPSGSGKTTLLHLIGTLDRPTGGTVRVTGFDISQLSDRELSALRAGRIGFVFQQFFLAEHQSVLDNVADGLLYAGASFSERRRAAANALARVSLSDKLAVLPTKLSGGQRQRVAIARALVGRPALLLADEPTGNLDSSTGQSVLDLFAELNNDGATIVVITHDHGVAQRMGRVIELLDGRVLADSGPTGMSGANAMSGPAGDNGDSEAPAWP